MKFPKSMHAEGWLSHIDTTAPGSQPDALKRATGSPKRIGVHQRIEHRPRILDEPSLASAGFTAVPPAPAAATSTPRRSAAAASPWVLGAGVGMALIVVAVGVSVSRKLSSVEPSAPPPIVVSEVQTPSPQDKQLLAEPSAAGTVTAAPEPAPVAASPVAVATAPAVPKVEPAVQPKPDVKTLSAKPEMLARAAPPTLAPRESALQPIAPVVTPVTPVTPPTAVPETTAPVVPPLAQQQPQAAEPEDSGITVQVRMALSTDAVLSAVPIAVSTDHGVVKLEGQAPDAQARERATVVASATSGVKAVDNRLTLPPVAALGSAQTGG
ncbi:MAG: BON domain-containing protein [Burkholderiales bacterium]|nr:BON domain-containing protein [Burkholderiales bacterium]